MMFAVSNCAWVWRPAIKVSCACCCSAARFGSGAIWGGLGLSIVAHGSALCDEVAIQGVRPQRTRADAKQVRDGRGAEHPKPHQRQVFLPDIDGDRRVAL